MPLRAVALFDDNLKLFAEQLKDIENARRCIYLEIYRLNNDTLGKKFIDALAKKAAEGLTVKLLLDSWGTNFNPSFFKPITDAGGTVRFFEKLRLTFYFISKNHRRNHRKLLIIDNEIVYIGSSNITTYSLTWRELNLRIADPVAHLFKKAFADNFEQYKGMDFDKFRFKRDMRYGDLTIMQEIPAISRQRLKKKYEELIRKAQKEVVIETPYFLPGFRLRKELMNAAARGVKVQVIVPKHSDVLSVDIVRRRYYGMLHEQGVSLCFYTPGNLHAKCMFVDGQIFSISSANFDYRSFRYQHEISFVGKDPCVGQLLQQHIDGTLSCCSAFDYERWLRRSTFEKFVEWMLLPFRFLM